MSGLGPLTMRELKKWYRNPVFLITGLIQPFFWVALFGSAFDFTKLFSGFTPPGISVTSEVKLALDGAPNYITYIVGGVLTITGLFTAMFAGTNIIFDRRLGPMGRFLSSPIRRSSIVLSKILSAINLAVQKPSLDEVFLEYTGRDIRAEDPGDARKAMMNMRRLRR